MGWFGKKQQVDHGRQSAAPPTQVPQPQEKVAMQLRDPGLDDHDPRQIVHKLLCAAGIAMVFTSPGRIESTMTEVVRRVPLIRNSEPLNKGFHELVDLRNVHWVAMDGPRGSAFIVVPYPEADTDMVVTEVSMPLGQGVQAPFRLEIVSRGQSHQGLVDRLATAEVVPPWNIDAFRHLAASHPYPTLPAGIHRAAAHWVREGSDLYKRHIETEENSANVMLGLIDGAARPMMLLSLGDQNEVSNTIGSVVQPPYKVFDYDDLVLFAREVPADLDAAQLDSMANQFLLDLGRFLNDQTRADLGSALPQPVARRDLWAELEDQNRAPQLVRRLESPRSRIDYTWIARVREAVPEDESNFELVEREAMFLHQVQGSGFESAWWGEGGVPLAPAWLGMEAAALDIESGRFVASGLTKHGMWGLSPAYDLGAIDGRNAFSFTKEGHDEGLFMPYHGLYVGSFRTGAYAPLDLGGQRHLG